MLDATNLSLICYQSCFYFCSFSSGFRFGVDNWTIKNLMDRLRIYSVNALRLLSSAEPYARHCAALFFFEGCLFFSPGLRSHFLDRGAPLFSDGVATPTLRSPGLAKWFSLQWPSLRVNRALNNGPAFLRISHSLSLSLSLSLCIAVVGAPIWKSMGGAPRRGRFYIDDVPTPPRALRLKKT